LLSLLSISEFINKIVQAVGSVVVLVGGEVLGCVENGAVRRANLPELLSNTALARMVICLGESTHALRQELIALDLDSCNQV